ncbi:DNA helicase UvrD [Paenibacillus sp. CAA11]|uniref:UvrD-helicase domain-containing protein n=1 Tax=Paenibacillus sp. CAA11 TaxID=1532905 RepID=UPI000D341079|nr:UvrD-helicase domain-containing protein [Paenibacillus sp. CAA11]AWB43069.1 DNA helicase UvrD [Paenibacillus sp. CAA11]
MPSGLFQNRPFGAEGSIPRARLASARTSRELVSAEDRDAGYFRRLEEHGILLNRAQLRAVRHGNGPLLTLAGAGSGKTSVLVCRTGYLIDVRGIQPSSILLVTFSSKAAAEMRERISTLPGLENYNLSGLQARTFHAFFLRFLYSRGLTDEIFAETGRQHLLLKQIMREQGLPQDTYQPETLLSLLSSYKMNLIEVQELPEQTESEREVKRIFQAYEHWKIENGKIDFDDVLLRSYRMLKDEPRQLRWLQDRFRYLMVDEFQDTNLLQYELVKMIAGERRNLMVVGDDDQTIYSFNGARSEFILDFDKEFPDARVITLDINYRSGSAIVGLGNDVIRHNAKRRVKTLQTVREGSAFPKYIRPYTTDKEAEFILEHIEEEVLSGRRSYGDFAVLYRAASNNRAILEQLILRNLPYIDYGDGQLLYQHRIVQPVIDYLRLSLDRRNFLAMESVLPSMYINRNKGMAHILEQEAIRAKKGPLVHLLTLPGLKDFQLAKIKDRLELIRSLRTMKPNEAILHIRTSFYNSYLEADDRGALTMHREMLKELLDELETSAERFSTVAEFIQFVEDLIARTEQNRPKTLREQGNRIALMTIHRSKGLEFPVVFVIGASEGSLPHSSALDADRMKDIHPKLDAGQKGAAALEEERRLAYVAITRAREELFLSSPARYRGKKTDVSRFLLSAFRSAKPGAADGKSGTGGMGGGTARTAASAKMPPAPGARRAAYGSGAEQAQAPARARRTHTVPAWVCSKPGCIAWVRIASDKEARLTHKACPLCKADMHRGTREIPV